jgi:hypothetical protein
MKGLLAIAVLALILAVIGVGGVVLARIRSHGLLVLAWRFLTGHPWHGQATTDAGWLRPGTKALTRTGHASRFHHRPRLHRTAIRAGSCLAVVLVAVDWLEDPALTGRILAVLAVLALAFGAVHAVIAARGHNHRRKWVDPLHVALAPLLSVPLPAKAESWLQVERDRGKAVLALPPGFTGNAREQEQIASVVSAKLGLESPDVKWHLAGPKPTLTLLRSQPPPSLVRWDDVSDAVAAAGANELVAGIGKRGAITRVSLHDDSPHFGISMGSGGGKSNLAAFWLLQELRRGAIGMVLDAKWFSHPWLFKDEAGEYAQLPNVAYARSAAQLHSALIWLGGELERRNQVAMRAVDARGRVHGTVGPRILIIAEELNLATPKLQQHWAEIRDPSDPKRSPALTALGEVAFAGRAVKMHMIIIGQMLTAKTLGGGDVRENMGVKAMARYSANSWKMQAPDLPMPPSPSVLGRVQVVASGTVRETQIPLVDLGQARELVLAGTITPCPAGMPGAVAVTGSPRIAHTAPEQGFVTVTDPLPVTGSADAISLSEAVGLGIIGPSLAAVRIARHRDEDFPAPAGQRGLAHLYDPQLLAEWNAGRRA